MRLVVSKKYDLAFVSYLWKLIKIRSLSKLDSRKLKQFSDEFGFNFINAVEFSFNNARVTETDDYKLVSFSNYALYHDMSCSKIIDILTYGTRTIKGVTAIKEEFDYVNANIDALYER